MFRFIYNILVSFFQWIVMNIPIPKKGKFSSWVTGQKQLLSKLTTLKKSSILFIISSSGEYEQAKPVIDQLSKNYPDIPITLAFFSPSGYESLNRKQTNLQITYLPLDQKQKVTKFLDALQPRLVFFVKYELWLNLMTQLRERNIPRVLFSAVFPKNHFIYKWYSGDYRSELSSFSKLFVQDDQSVDLLHQVQIAATKVGDTRIDRSLELPNEDYDFALFDHLPTSTIKVVLGSVWPKDLDLFFTIKEWLKDSNIQLIIAPHELDKEVLKKIKKQLNTINFQDNQNPETVITDHILINQVGVLKYIYRYGQIAFIGGGFGKGIHNTLEPAAYKLPILFGPKYQKFIEATAFREAGSGFSVKNASELKHKLELLIANEEYKSIGEKSYEYLVKNQGASQQIVDSIANLI